MYDECIMVSFEDLDKANLVVDCIYKGGTAPNLSSEPFHKLIPGCENSGGFRKTLRKDGSRKYAYVVLYTSMEELEWPDFLEEETGIFRYYGDNRKPGNELTNTKKKGNKILEDVFELLNSRQPLDDMPPFLVFKKTGNGRDVKFLGLAAPGNPRISPDKDLVAFWRSVNGNRFQNYEAYFTILDTGAEPIQRKWLEALIEDHANSDKYAPKAWLEFKKNGRNGIKPLTASRMLDVPKKYIQLQSDEEGRRCLEYIREHYKINPYGFESCAIDLIKKMDNHFTNFNQTRPWRDGGRDALGQYKISAPSTFNHPLRMDCALEAKCYSTSHSVGVREMSRLISRIRYRQFGIMITTSYVDTQAYKEVLEDGHPILIITASDIASILRCNSIDTTNIEPWIKDIDEENAYFIR